MADIELVIKIPEELYRAYKDRPPMLGDVGMDMIAQAIANGTPLPKGHGRLIDADAITKDLNTFQDAFAINIANGRIIGIACSAPTIIEADKAGEEIHCNYTDAEIAKSFIEDVEAVKDLLPRAESEE